MYKYIQWSPIHYTVGTSRAGYDWRPCTSRAGYEGLVQAVLVTRAWYKPCWLRGPGTSRAGYEGLVQAVLVTRAWYKPCWLRGPGTSRAGYEGLVQAVLVTRACTICAVQWRTCVGRVRQRSYWQWPLSRQADKALSHSRWMEAWMAVWIYDRLRCAGNDRVFIQASVELHCLALSRQTLHKVEISVSHCLPLSFLGLPLSACLSVSFPLPRLSASVCLSVRSLPPSKPFKQK